MSTDRLTDRLTDRHHAKVLRLALRLTGNRADAEDLAQEVFVRAVAAGDSLRPDSLDGWLHRVTTNLFLDQARRRSRIRIDAWGDHLEARVRPAPPADLQLLTSTLDADVEQALGALAPQVRAVVVLTDLEGLSYAETAAVLRVKVGTVRSRLHRGRAQLRRALAHRRPRKQEESVSVLA
jgi:RNA polymerase sigma-70 factor (ECF subfamily)